MSNGNGRPDELRDFMAVLRRALLQVVRYIEARYGFPSTYD